MASYSLQAITWEDGNHSVEVEFAEDDDSRPVSLSIRGNGNGITQADLRRILANAPGLRLGTPIPARQPAISSSGQGRT